MYQQLIKFKMYREYLDKALVEMEKILNKVIHEILMGKTSLIHKAHKDLELNKLIIQMLKKAGYTTKCQEGQLTISWRKK